MARKITIHDDYIGDYTVDLERKSEGYQKGDLICFTNPFFNIPLRLEIAIRADGNIIFRNWSWEEGHNPNNQYLHTNEKPNGISPFIPTEKQIDTVNGLWSGRITFEGLKLPVGGSIQDICLIDVKKEETLINDKIFLA